MSTLGQVAFADIPEIVFVEQLPETEELGLFVLDPARRTRPGDDWWLTGQRLQHHEAVGGGDYRPPQGLNLLTAAGRPPAGVTYDPETGQLHYDGSQQNRAVTNWTVYLCYTADGDTLASQAFRIRVLRPTIVFGEQATTANRWKGPSIVDTSNGGTWFSPGAPARSVNRALRGASTDAVPHVIFVTPGEYLAKERGLDFYTPRADHLYIVGDPANRPVLAHETLAFARWRSNQTTYLKNLELVDWGVTGSQFNLDAPQAITLWKLLMRDGEMDQSAIATPNWEAMTGKPPVGPAAITLSLVNLRMLDAGGRQLKHPIYVQGRPNTRLHSNNLYVAGGRDSSGIKSTMYRNRIRNTHVQVSRTLTANEQAPRLAKGIDITAASDTAIYNSTIIGMKEGPSAAGMGQLVYWRARRSEFGGEMPPPADLSSSAPFKTSIPGGGYAPPGGLPDGWESTPATYMNPNFWKAVGERPLSDPSNAYSFKKFVSFTHYEWRARGKRAYTAYRDDGTFPGFVRGTNPRGPWPVVTSPWWRERSASFMANNRYVGWLSKDLRKEGHFRAFAWTPRVVASREQAGPGDYYGFGDGPWPGVAPFEVDFDRRANHVYLGGDTGPHPEADVGVDGDGQPRGSAQAIALPDWFQR